MAEKKIMVKVAPTTGDPIKGTGEVKQTTSLGAGGTTIDRDMDLRDRLMELVGKGNILNSDEKAGIYSDLTNLVGQNSAQKLMNHAYIFNTRPDIQKLPLEEKLNAFYSIGSNDPYVHDVITKTKALGYGVGPGFRTSHSQINQQLAGRIPVISATEPTEQQKKIMIRVRK
jgi:hypothetical protein